MFDTHSNLAVGTIATPPVPDLTGTILTLSMGQGPIFHANEPCTIFPPNVSPTRGNAEIAYITAVNGDSVTIDRGQEGISAKSIGTGWTIMAGPTAKSLTDIEKALDAKFTKVVEESAPGSGIVLEDSNNTSWLVTINTDGSLQTAVYFDGSSGLNSAFLTEDGVSYFITEDAANYISQEA